MKNAFVRLNSHVAKNRPGKEHRVWKTSQSIGAGKTD